MALDKAVSETPGTSPAHLSVSRSLWSRLQLSETQKSWLCVLALGLLPFLLFWEVATFRVIPFVGDITASQYPLQHFIQQAYREGYLPLWNDLLLSGMPNSSVYGTFYPPSILLAFVPTWLTHTYFVLFNFALSGIFTYLYTRTLGLSRKGAFLAGAAFMLCGFAMGHLGHHTINRTLPWLPLILWAFENWRRRFALRYLGVGALATGIMFLGGHPQVPMYSMIVSGIYILYFTLWPDRQGSRWKIFLGATGMLVLGLIIASPVLWDLYDLARFGGRGVPKEAAWAYFTSFSVPLYALPQIFFPWLFQTDAPLVEAGGYTGILTVALALLGAGHWRHRARLFWAAVALCGIVLVLGSSTPLYRPLFYVPVYNSLRIPARNWYEVDFAVAILAGAGLDWAISAVRLQPRRAAAWLRGVAVGLMLVILGCVAASLLFHARLLTVMQRNGVPNFTDWRIWLPVALIAGSALILLLISQPRLARVAAWVALAFVIMDLFYSVGQPLFWAHSTRRPPADIFAELFPPGRLKTLAALPANRADYRVFTYTPIARLGLDDQDALLTPDTNLLFGIRSADGYVGGLVASQYREFLGNAIIGDLPGLLTAPSLFQPQAKTALNLAGVRYIIVSAPVVLCCNAPVMAGGVQFRDSPMPVAPYAPLDLSPATQLLTATIELPATPATDLALSAAFMGGALVPQGTTVGRVKVTDLAGNVTSHALIAGKNIADIAHTCFGQIVGHREAPVAFKPADEQACGPKTYLDRFAFSSQPTIAKQVTIENLLSGVTLRLDKMSLFDAHKQTSYPVSTSQGYVSYFVPTNGYRLIYADDRVRIFENTDVLPKAFLVPHARQVADLSEATRTVRLGQLPDGRPFLPRELALVDTPVLPLATSASGPQSGATDSQLALGAGHAGYAILHTTTAEDSFLVYSETYFPAWQAVVDGQPVPVYRVDGNLMGVPVPAGEHEVVFTYRPVSMYLALLSLGLIAVISIALLALALSSRFPRSSWSA